MLGNSYVIFLHFHIHFSISNQLVAAQLIVGGNDLAVTLIPGSPRPTLTYQTPLINDPKQTWEISGGYIFSAAPVCIFINICICYYFVDI